MYQWRKLSPQERANVLAERKKQGLPWHRPPHYEGASSSSYLITAACYEHLPHISKTEERIEAFQKLLLERVHSFSAGIHAWSILPNHYHVLVRCEQVKPLLAELGRLHGRTSFAWNGEDLARGRTVWHGATERCLRSDRHFFATLNYVHHNAVKHGYVEQWQDWKWSSVHEYLEDVGREEARRVWKAYPILDYGAKWDTY